jgi:excisionase family DNA binding protein
MSENKFKDSNDPGGSGGNESVSWYTPEEAAERLRINKKTVYRMCHEGQLKHKKCGSKFRIPRIELEQF